MQPLDQRLDDRSRLEVFPDVDMHRNMDAKDFVPRPGSHDVDDRGDDTSLGVGDRNPSVAVEFVSADDFLYRHGIHRSLPSSQMTDLSYHLLVSRGTIGRLRFIKIHQKPAVTRQRLVAASAVTGGVSYARPPEPETPTYFVPSASCIANGTRQRGANTGGRHVDATQCPRSYSTGRGRGGVLKKCRTSDDPDDPAAAHSLSIFPSAPVAGPVSGANVGRNGETPARTLADRRGALVDRAPSRSHPASRKAVAKKVEQAGRKPIVEPPHRNFSSRGVSRPTDLLPGRSVASAAQLAGAVTATPAVPASFLGA